MNKILLTLSSCFILFYSHAQTGRKLTANLMAQYSKTLYDITRINNPWAVGAGIQLYYNTAGKWRPTAELTTDLYLESGKVAFIGANGKMIEDVGTMINLFGGFSYQPSAGIFLDMAAGPSFTSGRTSLGIKSSAGTYFTKTHRSILKLSYINVFNRYQATKSDFGTISVAIGFKLF